VARSPKGSYFRSTPDWFWRSMATVGFASGSTGGTYPQAGLYNNATDGQLLHVMGLSMHCSGAGEGIDVSFAQGVPAFSAGRPGTAVKLDEIAPPGLSYFTNGVGAVPGYIIGYLGAANAGTFATPGWPLWIIPPGYTLWFNGDQTNTFFFATLWYLHLKE